MRSLPEKMLHTSGQIWLREGQLEQVEHDYPGYLSHVRKGILSTFPDFRALCHWHQEIELIYIQDGGMDYRINREKVRLEKGEGLFVNSRQLHYGYSEEHQECVFLCVLLHPLLLCSAGFTEEKFILPVINHTGMPWLLLRSDTDWQQQINEWIQQIYEVNQKSDPQLMTQGIFFQIWDVLYRHLPEESEKSPVQNGSLVLVREMMQFIDQHYSEKTTVSDIAGAAHVSVSKCYSLFHEYLSQTPVEYLTRLRLEKSLEMMKDPSVQIVEAALAAGFSGASYFSETFRKYYKCTPGEYRKGIKP